VAIEKETNIENLRVNTLNFSSWSTNIEILKERGGVKSSSTQPHCYQSSVHA